LNQLNSLEKRRQERKRKQKNIPDSSAREPKKVTLKKKNKERGELGKYEKRRQKQKTKRNKDLPDPGGRAQEGPKEKK
jgi:hypothetical protein